MTKKTIKVSSIELNTGQIPGLPKNPRFIMDDRFNKLVASIESLPEMMELREVIVYPFGKKLIAIAGNMRLRACKQLGWKEVPCKILDASTPVEKLKEIAIKDNVAFGENDFEMLSLEWDTDILGEWGLDIISPIDFSDKNQEIDVDQFSHQMTIKLTYSEKDFLIVKEKLSEIAETPELAIWKLLKQE